MSKPDGHAVNNSNSGRETLRTAIYTMKSEVKKKKKKLRFKEWLLNDSRISKNSPSTSSR